MINYKSKLTKTRMEIFEISLELKRMFDQAMKSDDEKFIKNVIKTIKKIQKKSYTVINRKKLNDYHGGTHRCYPGGEVDCYRPHTDKQNIIDFIDYFFINNCSTPDEFNKKYSYKLHEHEEGMSFGIADYSCTKYPKQFFNANCWENILKNKAKELLNLIDEPDLDQNMINKINSEYGAKEKFEDKEMI